ncbi:immunoglobulin superfamily member 6 [Xenopus laevis]|uniref:Immunoglobulin domain-containing protein n=1 Tax=Xenopus laevis TaxID=8355 RepID=A0A974C085_XENLA|nr:immunoglobulin superfamily member 6 [Xenopus laevis]OCT64228.1 hypothetical protein XELAEV_18045331mg [Xenopus laevis]
MALRGFQVSVMFQLLWACCDVAEGCTVTVAEEHARSECQVSDNITLSCEFTYNNCKMLGETYWFRCLVSHCEKICDKPCVNGRFKVLANRTVQSVTTKTVLHIDNVHANDSAIYICGARDSNFRDIGSKAMGQGTTLVVKDEAQSIVTTGCVVLIVFCVLLLLYNIAVFSIYAFRSKLKMFKEPKTEEAGSTNKSYRRQRIFQAIAQEYHKRYPRKSMSPNSTRVDDAIYQNTQGP